MTSAFLVMFVSTLALLGMVKDTLAAAHYSQPSRTVQAVLSETPSDPKLFDKISFYPESNLGRALMDLRVMASRIALIVPQGDTYENQRQGQVATAARNSEFMVIIADRDFSIDAAQMQSTRSSPGILNLKDLTVQLLTRKSFVIESRIVWFAPREGAVVQIDWKDDNERAPKADMKGRESWHQLFIANAGDQRTEIGRRT